MNLPEDFHKKRLAEFPDPIRVIGMSNTYIHRIIREYAQGQIIIREEALCQMVVVLADHLKKMTDKAVALTMRTPDSVIMGHDLEDDEDQETLYRFLIGKCLK